MGFGKINLRRECVAAVGELIGTAMFLFLGLGGIKTAISSQTASQTQTATDIPLSNQTILFISTSMGLSLLITAWLFYRVTGGLFNPAVTLALWLVGAVTSFRAITLTVAQITGGIAGAALVAALTPISGIEKAITTLEAQVNVTQGLWLEAFLTAMLVFAVLMLAAEKHKATYLAPIGIGLTLFVCQLFGTLWTGCGMNPARAFGPSVVAGSFPHYHWIYWVGPIIGSLISVFFYAILKACDYGSVVLGQDSDDASKSAPIPIYTRIWRLRKGGSSNDTLETKENFPSDSAIDSMEQANGVHENGGPTVFRRDKRTGQTFVEHVGYRPPSSADTTRANGPSRKTSRRSRNSAAGHIMSHYSSEEGPAQVPAIQSIAAQGERPTSGGVTMAPEGQNVGGIRSI